MAFDRFRTNVNSLNPFVVSLSNHTQIELDRTFPSASVFPPR
jgi:hypothetical protein